MSVPRELTHDALPRVSANLSMGNISLEDLDLLERDLLFYEKVSVCFLLHREFRDLPFILQQLTIAFRVKRAGGTKDTTIITQWARNDPDYKWREHLVEALSIVKCNKVLRKLGFELNDLRATYHPDVDEYSVHVHPILKILYRMCEKVPRKVRQAMVQHICSKFENCENFGLDAEDFLELYLLSWMQNSQKIISIGDRNGAGAHFSELLAFLKVNDQDEYYDKLRRFTETSMDASTEGSSSVQQMRRPERTLPLPSSNEDNFHIDPNEMGYALIVNEKNFHKEPNRIENQFLEGNLPTRHGTEMDVKVLRETLTFFGFNVIVKDDLTSEQILSTVAEYVDKTQSTSSSLVVVILSHGLEGSVYGSNSIPVEIRSIKEVLCAEKLKDMPKILILQACQSNEEILNGKLTSDAPVRVDAVANLLTAHSTAEGFKSMRHTTQGTWFIQTLCAEMLELYTKEHFVDILTKVTNKVADKVGDGGERMIPKFETTLKKKLYLRPRLDL